jgi:methionyl-tRNA formyltransferase
MKVVFFGTPLFAAKLLEYLVSCHVEIVAVVTRPDKPVGRSQVLVPPEVKKMAAHLGLQVPVYQPVKASDPLFLEELSKIKADFFVVAAYGQILKESLLIMPLKGAINVHTSLLPRFRGAAPIQRAIMAGDKRTGVTIMKMVKELDAGDMLLQVPQEIPSDMDAYALEEALCEKSKDALFLVLKEFDNITPQVQNEKEVTFAPKIEAADLLLDWNKSAEVLHNQIRAVTKDGGAYTFVTIRGEKKRLKILSARISEKKEPFYGKEGWGIKTGHGILELLKVQLEGKTAVSAKQFIVGYKEEIFVYKILMD